jgi:hypothetical protein
MGDRPSQPGLPEGTFSVIQRDVLVGLRDPAHLPRHKVERDGLTLWQRNSGCACSRNVGADRRAGRDILRRLSRQSRGELSQLFRRARRDPLDCLSVLEEFGDEIVRLSSRLDSRVDQVGHRPVSRPRPRQ